MIADEKSLYSLSVEIFKVKGCTKIINTGKNDICVMGVHKRYKNGKSVVSPVIYVKAGQFIIYDHPNAELDISGIMIAIPSSHTGLSNDLTKLERSGYRY